MATARRDPKKNRPAEGAPSDSTSVLPSGPAPPMVERITWGKLKLRYLPLERRKLFVKPDDEDED